MQNPTYTQRSIIGEIGRKAAAIVVMSRRAVEFLTDIYNIPEHKVFLIEHGVPEFEKVSRKTAKLRHNMGGKKLLFTFGLLSRNKGIETVIAALPEVVRYHPNLLYVVLGITHPNVIKHSGEEYREYLWRMVKSRGLEKHVYFKNEFADEDMVFEYLNACDVYITPYLNEAQITSGTLSYAVGSGCAVVSTPYWHAQELLDNGRGRLFNFRNSEELAEILNDLLGKEEKLVAIRKNASDYGKTIRWPKIGKQYLELSEKVKKSWRAIEEEEKPPIDIDMLPLFSLGHIKRLTDDTGMIQHAKYGVPNLREGYCVDDNSRAILMALMSYRQYRDEDSLRLIYVYLSFIHYMQRENGNFRNHLSFDRRFLDEYGSEDSFGRTVWALGYLICFPPNDPLLQTANEMFKNSVQHLDEIHTIRGAANTIIGLCYYLKKNSGDEEMIQRLKKLTTIITSAYIKSATSQWKWFENILTYDNAIIPMALLYSFEITGEHEVFEIAMDSLQFLESKTMSYGYFSAVGNNGWYKQGGEMAQYDQQPIDAMAMVLLYYQLFEVTKDSVYINRLFTCYQWFLGENSLRLPLYDNETGGCCDGLEPLGVNLNQGAESTLAYWISHLTVLAAQEKEHLFFHDQPDYEMSFANNDHNGKEGAPGNPWKLFRSPLKKSERVVK